MKTKTLITALLLLYSITTTAQVVSIPDPNFKWRLLNHIMFGGASIDTNYDGEIQVTEAEAVTELIVGDPFITNNQITDMTGIEAFINITSLQCIVNNITTLDLSQNTALEVLDCSSNDINTLNVSQCVIMKELICWENNLSNIDISNNTILEVIRCYNNNLLSLETNQNILLEKLYCGTNQLSDIDVSQNLALKHLICYSNDITSLDVKFNSLLERIACHHNQLLTLDLRNNNNTNIAYFNALDNPSLTCIFVDNIGYSTDNWINIDPASTFVETQAECDAIGIEEVQFSKNFTIYPNPTIGIINLEYSSNNCGDINVEFIITDILGKELLKSQITNYKSQINITDTPKGIYFLTIKSNNKFITQKIIKL